MHFKRFIAARIDRHSFFGLPFTLIIIGCLYIVFLLTGVVQMVINSNQVVRTDLGVQLLFHYIRYPLLTGFFLDVTLLGTIPVVLAAAIIVSLATFLYRRYDYIPYLWLTIVLIGFVSYIGKLAFHRLRPIDPVYIEPTFSFPSTHAMIAVAFYGFILYIILRHHDDEREKISFSILFAILIFLIMFSRLYLGVHYLSDVWGGFLIGLLILAIVVTMHEWHMEAHP